MDDNDVTAAMQHDAVTKLLKRDGMGQESATSADSASSQGGSDVGTE